jgi:hypothetical protein
MEDPRRLAALKHLIDLAANVEAQLSTSDRTPIKAILVRAQDEAATALVKLTEAPPDRPDVIRAHQTAVWRYDSLVTWLREIMAEGDQAAEQIDDVRTLELRRLIGADAIDEETLKALGINSPGAPSE